MPLFKKDVRKDYLAKRLALSEAEAGRLNAALLEHCRELELGSPNYIHLFLPIAAKKEVDTFPLADWLRRQYPGVQLVLSRSYLATGGMQHFRWDEVTRLVHNSYGIPEPESGELVAPQDIDVVFVPMLAFDNTGQRVGYGHREPERDNLIGRHPRPQQVPARVERRVDLARSRTPEQLGQRVEPDEDADGHQHTGELGLRQQRPDQRPFEHHCQ